MKNKVNNVLVVGAGIGGTALAIALQKIGIATTLIDIQDKPLGIGIFLTSNTLRAVQRMGLLDACMEHGFCADSWQIFDEKGNHLLDAPLPRAVGPEYPASIALERPVLLNLLRSEAVKYGADLRVGTSVTSLHDNSSAVSVTLSDGTNHEFDLVVGADGTFSSVRKLIFGNRFKPSYTGQSCWRWQTARHPNVDRPHLYHGSIKLGLIPLSKETMYLLINDNIPEKRRFSPEELFPQFQSLLKEFTADTIIETCKVLDQDSEIIFRPYETLTLPAPWHVGRVMLIGDAAHTVTAHLANGGGMAIEDAIVLAEMLQGSGSLASTLDAFAARRYDRCRLVYDNAHRIGQLEIDQTPGFQEEIYKISIDSFDALVQPM